MDNCKSKWYAIYTKRRKEDVVAFKLKNIGIGILNPKIKSKKYLRNRLLVERDNMKKVVRDWKGGEFNKQNFLKGWMPPHPTFFVRKEIYQKYGVFNTDSSCLWKTV